MRWSSDAHLPFGSPAASLRGDQWLCVRPPHGEVAFVAALAPCAFVPRPYLKRKAAAYLKWVISRS